MHPKEITPIQHQIELAVTNNLGYTDRVYFDQMRGRSLDWEDDTDVQFDLAYQSLRSALVTGQKDLGHQFYPECWKLIYLRRRLASSQPAVFLTTPAAVRTVIELTQTPSRPPIYDYQLPTIAASIQSETTKRVTLTGEDLAIIKVGPEQPRPAVFDPELNRIFAPREIINGYLAAIDPETHYFSSL